MPFNLLTGFREKPTKPSSFRIIFCQGARIACAMNKCLIKMRPPMLPLALDEELLPFQFHKPALTPLFQFPPQFSTGGTRYPIFLVQREKCLPFNPSLKEVYNKGDRRRSRWRRTKNRHHANATNRQRHRRPNAHRNAARYRLRCNSSNRNNKSYSLHPSLS